MSVELITHSLPQPAYTATQVLDYEVKVAKSAGIPMFELMSQAGQAVFDLFSENYSRKSQLLVVCGKGNNGGDGLVVAMLAKQAGYSVLALLAAKPEQVTGDARTAYQQAKDEGVKIIADDNFEVLAEHIHQFKGNVIVDALFGIGLSRALSAKWLTLVEAINEHHADVIAVDVPSGICATTGQVFSDAVVASKTVTFIGVKQGLLTGQAPAFTGELYLAGLGVNPQFTQSFASDVNVQGKEKLPRLNTRVATAHKGSIGLALAVGGNEGMPGAIRLASEAALRCGAALVAVCCHKSNQPIVMQGRPELMLAPDKADALADSSFIDKAKIILLGPGLGQNDWAQTLFAALLDKNKPMIIDADALRLLSIKPQYRENWVLTPHPGEAASLLGVDIATIESDRFLAVQQIAQKYGGICVLKGAGSLISDGENTWINSTGNAGMASGGMGDVLSGIIAALFLQSASLVDAVRLAVSIHGQAADIIAYKRGQRGMLASDLFEPLVSLVNQY